MLPVWMNTLKKLLQSVYLNRFERSLLSPFSPRQFAGDWFCGAFAQHLQLLLSGEDVSARTDRWMEECKINRGFWSALSVKRCRKLLNTGLGDPTLFQKHSIASSETTTCLKPDYHQVYVSRVRVQYRRLRWTKGSNTGVSPMRPQFDSKVNSVKYKQKILTIIFY